ncbi:hypothetical protein IAD21_01568 [Abditibacteriota bacterium]|nr:hypothetical protein IAD21_01568 [Abditibacteriota bacterium]
MKFPLTWLVVIVAPLLCLAARTVPPRSSVAQSKYSRADLPRSVDRANAAANISTKHARRLIPFRPPPTLPASLSSPLVGDGYLGKGAIENTTFWVRRAKTSDGFIPSDPFDALWALQRLPGFADSAIYGVNLSSGTEIGTANLKVVFHSRFHDGTPCGSWSATHIYSGPPSAYNIHLSAAFTAPQRVGWGWMWAEYWNNRGQKIGRSKDQLFLVLPVGIQCEMTAWKATGRDNEWARDVHVFAGAQMPLAWKQQPAFARTLIIPYNLEEIQPLQHIPLKLRVVPSPLIDKGTMPHSILSLNRGVTTTPPDLPLATSGSIMKGNAPRLIVTQTVQWQPGDSNQLDSARVMAELNIPTYQGVRR